MVQSGIINFGSKPSLFSIWRARFLAFLRFQLLPLHSIFMHLAISRISCTELVLSLAVTDYISNSDWYTITGGCCEGSLVGGYLLNFVLTLGNRFFPYKTDRNYILFIEELDKFQSVQDVSMFLTCIGQSRLMEQVTGLLFGHYSDDIPLLLFEVLERFGKKYNIPVAYCDDFGHGANHAIFPIGREAVLDTKNKTLLFQ